MTVLRYIDVVLIVAFAPIMLLIGVPAVGYGVGVGAWIVLRAVGIGVERYARTLSVNNRELTLRLAYPMVRIFALALAVILVRNAAGKDDGIATLAVVVFAFTIHLGVSFADRPGVR
jgi:hypothetical protein